MNEDKKDAADRRRAVKNLNRAVAKLSTQDIVYLEELAIRLKVRAELKPLPDLED